MPPPVNLSNVNLTLQQFQDVANGKYNAGEVRLTSDHSLGAVNNFVHRTGRNQVAIPHAEVLAIKDAFVKALQHEGIAANEINRVRQELGLAPVGTTDTALATRSIRPLSRQQIRNILDRYADTLTEHNDNLNIITYEANHINYTDRERTEIVRTRNRTNADLMKSRALLPDRRIVDVQNVIAGNVHFASQAERLRLIAVAESQKAFLTNGPGHPSDAPDASLRYPIPGNGPTLTFPLGMSEADYVRKLDDMLTLLRGERHPDGATLAVRNAFRKVAASGLEAVARWVAALAQDPQGAFKARTIAIGLLLDRGVDDWETLSLVNRVSDFAALTLLSQLTNQQDPNLRGDALRQDPAVAALAEQVEAEDAIPADRQAYVPALSSAEANANTINALKGLTMSVPTHDPLSRPGTSTAPLRRSAPDARRRSSSGTPSSTRPRPSSRTSISRRH